MFELILAIVAAYLLGSISFAVLVSKTMGLADPRAFGSKNPGATNVLRSGNKTAAAITLAGDALKGAVAVWLAQFFQYEFNFTGGDIALIGISAFVGHVYPVFLKFSGGKGVATALGVLLALNWVLGLACMATWLVIAYFFRYSSLASLITAAFSVFYNVLLFGVNIQALAITLMAGLLIYRHYPNIARLVKGKEGKIGEKNRQTHKK